MALTRHPPPGWSLLEIPGPPGSSPRVRRIAIETEARPDLCLFLDGELYLESMDLPGQLATLRGRGSMARTRCAAIPFETPAARAIDYTCNEAFNAWLLNEVLPALGHSPDRITIAGLSLSALGALFAAIRHPGVFSRCIAQSPSAWWRREWLRGDVAGRDLRGTRFRLSVGSEETDIDEGVSDAPMHQTVSQLDATRNLAEALRSAGADVTVHIFEGNHEMRHWFAELPLALHDVCQ